MSIKLKALGLGLFAAMAMGAFGVISATANTGGHFTSGSPNTTIVGDEDGNHQLDFISDSGGEIGCDKESYHGTMSETETVIKVIPLWSECYTTGSTTKFDVHENGCTFTFTVGPKPAKEDNTVHLDCPEGETIEITHPNCNIHIPPQSPDGGVVYTPDTINGKHAITMDVTGENITSHYESGFCVFLGTNHTADLVGSVTVRGESEGSPVDITATGK